MATFTWSPALMIDRIGGDDVLARQLVSLFIEEYPRMMAALRAGIDANAADAVRRAAHAFKGSVANFIDDGPVATAFQIEQLGKQNQLADVPALFARLGTEVDELVEHMRAFERGGR